jgi:hypothetical protein
MPTATTNRCTSETRLSKLHTSYQPLTPTPSPPVFPARTHRVLQMGASRELPMPTINRITSLNQAQATLLHCSTKLSRSWNDPSRNTPPASPIDAGERQQYQQWLDRWESAFTAFLSVNMPGMSKQDVSRCRVLKANHLSCQILAAENSNEPRSFDAFEADFQAIVELSKAVLHPPGSPTGMEAAMNSSSTSGVLDVRGPLSVVAARCNRPHIRGQAIELLGRTPSPRR